jgi:ubiquinone/menaquinone biosynthesis C-methylase UbiE
MVMQRTQRLFDHHAARYDRHAGRFFGRMYARVVDDVVAAAPHGGTVLDVGAGPGRLTVGIAARRPDLTVQAVDISADMVAIARRRAQEAGVADRVRVLRADVADLPLRTDSVDLVVSTASFHHWADVPGAARELTRVTRGDGRIWIYDFRLAPWRRLARATGAPIPRTRSGLLMVRGEVPTGAAGG